LALEVLAAAGTNAFMTTWQEFLFHLIVLANDAFWLSRFIAKISIIGSPRL
jgi:ABC-type glycerol-3-phosphate transport system permease component